MSTDPRQEAAAFYERALKDAPRESCCSLDRHNAFATSAGYDAGTVSAVPADAVRNSFGCGNPLAFADVAPGQTIVDLGSGAGMDLIVAAQKTGPAGKVIGIDLSETMIERARANVRVAGLHNVEVRAGAIERLPVESESVDWVISNCVINLSPDKRAVFREIHRVLRPGGRMLVSDMIAENIPDWLLSSAQLHSACLTGALSEQEYLGCAREAGLASIIVVDRFIYDDAALRALITDALPVSLGGLAQSIGTTEETVVEVVVSALHAKVHSLRIAGQRPA